MSVRNVFVASAVVLLIFGALLALVPAQMITQYGNTPELAHEYSLRGFGVAFLGLALIYWLARNAEPSVARRAIITSAVVTNILGLVVALGAVLSGAYNALGWIGAVLSAIFAVLFFILWQREGALADAALQT